MKESEEMRLKSTINESTLSTAARSPFPNGEGCEMRMPLFAIQRLSLGGRQRGGGFAAFSEKILFEYVFSCAFVNDSGNFLNNNIEMIYDLKIGISNNEDSELF